MGEDLLLSDKTIREMIDSGRIVITPFSPDNVQPASVGLHFSDTVLIFKNSSIHYVDLKKGDTPDGIGPVVGQQTIHASP